MEHVSLPAMKSPLAPDAFRHLVGGFASGVTIVTTRGPDGVPWGFTATAFSSVSIDPPLVLVCLDLKADCYPIFAVADAMGVNILAAGQHDLAKRFATRGIDKFAELAVTPGEHAAIPLLDGVLVHLECRVHARHAAGDHLVLIGEVLGGQRADAEPLLYHGRAFGRFQSG